MKVECIETSGKGLSDDHAALGYTAESVFDLTQGHVYVVYGISLWRNTLHYLLVGDGGSAPHWYPSRLFNVTKTDLPGSWHFADWDNGENEVRGIWGYQELVLRDGYFDQLSEMDKSALGVFEIRKEEIDQCS
jgi:hypothetical protein